MPKESYSRQKWKQAIIKILPFLIIFLVFILIDISYLFSKREQYGMIIGLLLGFLYYPVSKKMVDFLEKHTAPHIDPLAKQYKAGRQGEEGENAVYGWLKEIVQGESVFQNVTLPGHKCDIDFVVVNSKGVIALEVKNLTDKTFLADDGGYFQIKNDEHILLPRQSDPRTQAENHADYLRQFLNSKGLGNIKINKVLVYPNDKVDWENAPGVFIIKSKEALSKYLGDLSHDHNCTKEVCERIKDLLRPLSLE